MPHFLMKVGGSEQADLGRPVLLNPGWGGGGGGGGGGICICLAVESNSGIYNRGVCAIKVSSTYGQLL